MGWNSNSVFTVLIVSGGSGFTGVFVYSPKPATGALVASITAAAGTDPYGNAYQAGITVYDDTSPFLSAFVQLISRGLFFQTIGGGVTGQVASVGSAELVIAGPGNVADTVAELTFLARSISSSTGPAVLVSAGAAGQLTTGLLEVQGRTEIIAGSGQSLLKITQNNAAPGNVPVQILGQGAGDRALGVIVAGDTSNRWRVATDGTQTWGNGTISDATLRRVTQGRLAITGGLELDPGEVWLAPSGDTTGATDGPAINAALASFAKVRLIPGQLYYSNVTITLPGGKMLMSGNGYRTAAGAQLRAVGLTTGALIAPAAGTPAGAIIGLELDGTGLPAGTVDGIGCYVNCKQGSIIDVVAHHFTQHGINITQNGGNPDGWYLAQVSCHDNAGAGIFWDYAVDGQLEVAHLDHNASGLLVGTMNNWSAHGVRCQQNTGVGYGSTGGFIKASAAFTACGSENNGTHGWDFSGTNGQGAVTFQGCWARDDGTSGASGSGFAGFNFGGLGNDLIKIFDGCITYVTASAAGPDYGLRVTGDKGYVTAEGGMFVGSVAGFSNGGGNTVGHGLANNMITATGQDGTLAGYAILNALY